MEALHVVRPAAGGIRRIVQVLCASLGSYGVRCSVAAPSTMLGYFEAAFQRFPVSIAGGLRPHADVKAALELRRLTKGFDVVHYHGVRSAWVGYLAGCLSRPCSVVTLHNVPEVHTPLARFVLRRIVGTASQTIVVSHAIAQALTRQRCPPKTLCVIPNGVALPQLIGRPEARARLNIPEEGLLLLGVGRLSHEKGFDILVDAARQLNRPDIRVYLVGEGPQRPHLERAIHAARLEGLFILMGYQAELDPWYAAADVVIVPSRTEGQGLVALEAMAHARPVIASRVGGLPEVVVDNETGILVSPEEPETLKTAIETLLEDAPLRERMGLAGRQRVAEHFSLEVMLRQHVALYRKLSGA